MSEVGTTAAGALRITLIRSTIGRPKDQEATVRSLGLRRLHQTVERPDNAAIRGMVTKIRHLVSVEEVAVGAPAVTNAGGSRFVRFVEAEPGDQR